MVHDVRSRDLWQALGLVFVSCRFIFNTQKPLATDRPHPQPVIYCNDIHSLGISLGTSVLKQYSLIQQHCSKYCHHQSCGLQYCCNSLLEFACMLTAAQTSKMIITFITFFKELYALISSPAKKTPHFLTQHLICGPRQDSSQLIQFTEHNCTHKPIYFLLIFCQHISHDATIHCAAEQMSVDFTRIM